MKMRPWTLVRKPPKSDALQSLGDGKGLRMVKATIQNGDKPQIEVLLQVSDMKRFIGGHEYEIAGRLKMPGRAEKAFKATIIYAGASGDHRQIWVED